eukprot:239658-Pyramimonas_sp.AAC.1
MQCISRGSKARAATRRRRGGDCGKIAVRPKTRSRRRTATGQRRGGDGGHMAARPKPRPSFSSEQK